MPEWRVTWSIDTEADTPREAVAWVVAKMLGKTPGGWTPEDDSFEVESHETGEKLIIDLLEDKEVGEPVPPADADPEREFDVKVYRTAADLLSGHIRVHACSPDQAKAKAIDVYENDDDVFVDWECEEVDWPEDGGWLPELFEVDEVVESPNAE